MPTNRRRRGPDLWGPHDLPPLPQNRRRNTITLILGSKGSGKTTWMRGSLERLPRSTSLLVWDPQDEHRKLAGRRLEPITDPIGWLRSGRFPGVLSLRFPALRDDLADLTAAIAWTRPPSVLVIEEVQRLAPGGTAPKWLRDTVTTARHRACSLVFTSQRPAAVPKDLIANADRVVLFRLGYDDDRRALARSLGDPRILTDTADLRVGEHLLLEP